MNFSSITLGLFFATMLAIPTLADVYKVNEVVDGDTIKVVNIQDNFAKKVRLACIDSPEGDQPPGKLSTTTLKAFIPVGTLVELNEVEIDLYGRTVAEVIKNNVNVNLSMLKKGQAVVYQKYLSNCPDQKAYVEKVSKFE